MTTEQLLVQPNRRMARRKSGDPLFGGVWRRLYEDEIRSVAETRRGGSSLEGQSSLSLREREGGLKEPPLTYWSKTGETAAHATLNVVVFVTTWGTTTLRGL
jgi:hypothetical protein